MPDYEFGLFFGVAALPKSRSTSARFGTGISTGRPFLGRVFCLGCFSSTSSHLKDSRLTPPQKVPRIYRRFARPDRPSAANYLLLAQFQPTHCIALGVAA